MATAPWVRLVYVPALFVRARGLNVGLKALLVILLVAGALLEGTLPQLEGKGMVERALVYWVIAVAVPVTWMMLGRPGGRYPHLPDALLVAPPVGDIASNLAGLFERYFWWDSFGHFASWMLLCLGFGMLLQCLPIGRINLAALVIGFGSFTHILWELGEWLAQELLGTAFLHLTHEDTMWDFLFGLIGIFVATIALHSLHPQMQAERIDQGLPVASLYAGGAPELDP